MCVEGTRARPKTAEKAERGNENNKEEVNPKDVWNAEEKKSE